MSVNTTNWLPAKSAVQTKTESVIFNTLNPNNVGTVFNPNTITTENVIYTSSVDGSSWIWSPTQNQYITSNLSSPKYGHGTRILLGASQTIGVITSSTTILLNSVGYQYGTFTSADTAKSAIKLTAGYKYHIDFSCRLNPANNASGSVLTNFAISTNGTTFTQINANNRIETTSLLITASRTSTNKNHFVIAPTVDTWVQVIALVGSNASHTFLSGTSETSMSAFVIGVI